MPARRIPKPHEGRCDVYVDHKPYTQHDRVRCARKATFIVLDKDDRVYQWCTQHAKGRSRAVRNMLRDERIESGKTRA
jgi:hypothetical protein